MDVEGGFRGAFTSLTTCRLTSREGSGFNEADGPRIEMAALSKFRSFYLFSFNVSFQNEIPAHFLGHHDLSFFVLTEYDFVPLILKRHGTHWSISKGNR